MSATTIIDTAPLQGPQELGPERLRFGRADAQADDLPPARGVGGDSDYGGDGHDAPARALD